MLRSARNRMNYLYVEFMVSLFTWPPKSLEDGCPPLLAKWMPSAIIKNECKIGQIMLSILNLSVKMTGQDRCMTHTPPRWMTTAVLISCFRRTPIWYCSEVVKAWVVNVPPKYNIITRKKTRSPSIFVWHSSCWGGRMGMNWRPGQHTTTATFHSSLSF